MAEKRESLRSVILQAENILSSEAESEKIFSSLSVLLRSRLASASCRCLFSPFDHDAKEGGEPSFLSIHSSTEGCKVLLLSTEEMKKKGLHPLFKPEAQRLNRKRKIEESLGVASPFLSVSSLLSVPIISSEKKLIGSFIAIDKEGRSGYSKKDVHSVRRILESNAPLLQLQLRLLLSKLEQEQSLKLQHFRDQLTFMIVHDLKGPLSEVISNLDLLKEATLTEKEEEFLSSASTGCMNLWAMIMDMLDLAKLREHKLPLKKEALDIEGILRKTIDALGATAEEKALTVSLSALNLPPLEGDAALLRRVFTNLLLNAIHYSPHGSSIEVVAQRGVRKHLDISFQDHGEGIHPEDIPLIFNTFAQGRGSVVKCSTGLGLTLCKLAIEAHNGTINVESELGAGACFRVSLPIGGSRTMIDS